MNDTQWKEIWKDENGWNNFIAKNKIADENFKEFLKTVGNAKFDMQDYQDWLIKSGKSTSAFTSFTKKAGTALKSLGAAMASMAVNWAIGKVIDLIATGIDNYIHSAEKCKERVDDLMTSYKSALDEANNNAKTVENLADRYEELSKGVNNFGKNVSLTTQEYAEYNDIVNQIADMFPQLIQGYTDEGTAILSLKGNVEKLRDAYIDAQQEAYKMLIISGKDSDGNDIVKNWKNSNSNIGFSALREIGSLGLIDVDNISTTQELLDQLKTIYEMDTETLRNQSPLMTRFSFTDKDVEAVKRNVQTLIQTYQAELDLGLKNVRAIANAYLMTNPDYDKLDKDCKNAVSIIVNNINDGIANTFNTKEDVGNYVADIIKAIKEHPEVQNALVELSILDISKMQPDDVKSMVDQCISSIAEVMDDMEPIEIKTMFGFEDVDTIASNYRVILGKGAAKFATKNPFSLKESWLSYNAELDALEKFAEDYSINTQDEIAFWNQCIEESRTREEAMRKYWESPFVQPEKLSISETVEQIDKELRPAFSSLQSAYQEIFTIDEDTGEKIFTKLDEAEITDKFKPILDVLENLDEIEGINVDYSIYEDFISVLCDTSSTADDAEKQFNRLASYIIYTSGCTNMSAETFDLLAKSLNEMGVTNAYETLAKIRDAQEDLAQLGYDAEKAVTQEGKSITELGLASIETEEYLRHYLFQKELAQNPLSTTEDIAQLEELCNALGITGEMYQAVNTLKTAMDKKQQGIYDPDIDKTIEYNQQKLKDLANEYAYDYFHFDFDGANSKSSSSSKDTHKANYEKELQELENAHDMGLHSDEEYWETRIDLNEKYFGESSGMHQKYLDEYRDAEEAILGGIKDLWKDYYDQRKSELKDLISYAQELYDKEIDSLDASIEKLEERRDTEKMYWQNQIDDLGDEIDALQDANDEKQRAIDLQNKQYQLQKAMHQRTMLIYSESQGLHYVSDDKAVRDAKNDLDDAENDNKIEGLKKQQKDLQKQLDTILETYDSQIESIEKQIDSLNKVKSAWSEIVNNQELKELEERLKSIFGDDVKEKILSDNTDFINGIISQYSDTSEILKTIEDATLTDIQSMVSQYGVLPENLMYALTDMSGILKNFDTSGLNSNLDNTAQSLSNVTEKIQSEKSALNDLSDDISNYQIPAVNTDNFTASFAEDSDIMITINGFAERFKEICANLNNIWNTSFSDLGSRLGNFHIASVNAYASGTKRAQKGIAVVGEEKPKRFDRTSQYGINTEVVRPLLCY